MVAFEDSTSTTVDRRGGGGGRCDASRKGYCCSHRDCTLQDVEDPTWHLADDEALDSDRGGAFRGTNFFLDLKPRVKKLDVRFAFASCSMLD